MFVLTNKDALRTLPKMSRSKSWADAVVRNMKEKFMDAIHLEDRACVVNAQSSRDIEGLLEQVEIGLKQLLTGGPQEYALCEDVRLALQRWTADNPSIPIMRMKEFQELVQAQMRRKLEGIMAADSGRNAVLAYLHDVGEIIFPAGLDFMVVNPTWLGRGVLGSLIDAFRKIQEPGEGCLSRGLIVYVRDRVLGEVWTCLHHEHGFVSYENVEDLLSTSLRTMHLKEIITPKDLITLMIKLEMCFRKEPENEESDLFIPAVFDDDDELAAKGMCQREWKLGRSWSHCSAEHVGRRLQCENKAITFLSPGFFPRLQVVLRNHFYSKRWTENGAFQVDRNLIGFSHDGHEILVEYSGDIDCFVDILAKSLQPASRTLQFVQKHVIKRIVEFCASPQGCQGVLLVEAAIRHVCVEELHLCADRVDHAVLLCPGRAASCRP